MEMFVGFLHFIVIGFCAYKIYSSTRELPVLFWSALSVRLFAGIGVGLLYTFYYSVGDTFAYFQDAGLLAELAREDFKAYFDFVLTSQGSIPEDATFNLQQPRALFFVKIVSVFSLVTFDNYWVIAVYFSLFAFLGSWYLVKQFQRHFPDQFMGAAIGFLFFPSLVFWSSGLIKESLSMAGMYFLTGLFIKIWFRQSVSISEIVIALISAWILWKLKYYFAALFFPIVLTCVIFKFVLEPMLKPRSFTAVIVIWSLVFVLPLIGITFLHPNFSPARLMTVIVQNNEAFTALSSPQDLIKFSNLSPDPVSILSNAPFALLSGLFRPFIWEAGTLFQFFVSMENLLLMALTFFAFREVKLLPASGNRLLVLALLVYVIGLCVLITLSTPNFGTLSRYRVGYLPFVVMLVFSSKTLQPLLQRSFGRLVQ